MTAQSTEGNRRSSSSDISEQFLLAKITPPPLPPWMVPRPRIDRLIDKGVSEGTVTLVCGPPGAGKTTALAHWLAASRRHGPVAWLSLDEYHDAAAYFWDHLAAALRRAGVRLPQTGPGDDPDAPLLIASALAALDTPAVLVLDNLHLLHSPERLAGLGYLLRHGKPGLRVVAGSRTCEPLPLHQHRLTGDLTEIHAAQLAFTGPETTQLLARHDVTSYREALVPLVNKTEGWATGLRFVAIALSGDGAVDPGSVDQLIGNYLRTEAFETQAPRVRDIMLRISVPERITQDLAQVLTDQDQAAPALAELAAANLFIQPAGDGWYRCHGLFRDVLRARLREENPHLFGELLRRSAQWHRRHGRLADAVRSAVDAGDDAFAARMVVDDLAVGRLLDPDRGQALLHALRGIRRPAAPGEPAGWVCAAALALARADQCGKHGKDREAAAAYLEHAAALLRRRPPEREIASRLGAAEIQFAMARSAGDAHALAGAAADLEAAVARLPAAAASRHRDAAVRALAARGDVEFWLGNFDDAEKVYHEAATWRPRETGAAGETGSASPEPHPEQASCLGRIALAEALSGRLIRAAEFAAKAAARPGEEGCAATGEPPLNVPADIALALVHLERGDLPRVREALKRADAGLWTRPDRLAAAIASLAACWLHLAEGRREAALSMLAGARQDWAPPDWLQCRLTLAEARAATMAGNPLAALRLVSGCDAMPALAAATARAHAWAAAGDLGAARRELARVFGLAAAEPARTVGRTVIDALLVDARVHYAGGGPGERAAGQDSLVRALRIARGENIRLPFELEHSWLFPVFRTDADLARGYQALSHANACAGIPRPRRPAAAEMAEPPLVEPLTEREQEVLRRVAQLQSTAEIANELYISVNTVKTHLKSVHRKLAVTHRREAVHRAQQLNLL